MAEWLRRTLGPLLGPRLCWLGLLPQQELWALLPSAMVLVIPSEWEPFGYALLEAMCSGRPVFCSDRVGASYLLRGETASRALIEVKDAESFAARLLDVLRMPEEKRLSWGGEQLAAIRQEFVPERVAEAHSRYYRECMAAAAACTAPFPGSPGDVLAWRTILNELLRAAAAARSECVRFRTEHGKLAAACEERKNDLRKMGERASRLETDIAQVRKESLRWYEHALEAAKAYQELNARHQEVVRERDRWYSEALRLGDLLARGDRSGRRPARAGQASARRTDQPRRGAGPVAAFWRMLRGRLVRAARRSWPLKASASDMAGEERR